MPNRKRVNEMALEYYSVLGLSKEHIRKLDTGSAEDVKTADNRLHQAFLRLSKAYHPDLNPDDIDAEDKFKKINEAYRNLNTKEARDNYERVTTVEDGFDDIRNKIDIFIEYISLLSKYRPHKKSQFSANIEEFSPISKFIKLFVTDYDLEKVKIKRGAIISIHSYAVNTEGDFLYNHSLIGMVKLVMGNSLKVVIIDARKSKLQKGGKVVIRLDESTRFLYDNILRNMEVIIGNPIKYEKFRNLITYVYNNSSLSLSTLDIAEPEKIQIPKYFKESEDGNFRFNDEQKEFIAKAADLLKNDDGYFLSCNGPGGTGKTECIVEVIKQAICVKKDIRILVSSFTNVAVDNVFVSLVNDTKIKNLVLRVAHEQHIKISEVKSVSLEAKRLKGTSSINTINTFNIIGATLDKLATSLFDDSFFDLIILDEASMIEFPKLMVAAAKTNKLIFIGDEHQLEPFMNQDVEIYLRSKGFDNETIDFAQTSFFVELNGYLKRTESKCLVTLLEQHRCYDEIIQFSNSQWYHELRTKLDPSFGQQYSFLKNVNFSSEIINKIIDPTKKVVWIETSHLSNDLKYSSNKGWHMKFPMRPLKYFNAANASFSLIIIRELLYALAKRDKSYRTRIGLISPFNNQVDLVHKFLYNHPDYDPFINSILKNKMSYTEKDTIEVEKFAFLDSLELGTVHKFQGREKDIIIFDITSYTGDRDAKLLLNYKLLNVALTRARYKLIIIGTVRDDTPIYSELRSDEYTHLIGVLKGDFEKRQISEEIKKTFKKQNLEIPDEANLKKIVQQKYDSSLGAEKKKVDIFKQLNISYGSKHKNGSYDTKLITDYLKDYNFSKTFTEICNELNKLENNLIELPDRETALSEEEAYEFKVDEIYKKLPLDNTISEYQTRYNLDIAHFKIVEKYLKEFFKTIFLDKGYSTEISALIRHKLDEFDKDIDKLMNIIKRNEGIAKKIDRLKEYDRVVVKFDKNSGAYYILQLIMAKLKIDLNFINYKERIEQLYGIKLTNVESIVENKMNAKLLDRLVAALKDMHNDNFPAKGRQLCMAVLTDKVINFESPAIYWFKNLITTKPANKWDVKLWLALRVKYENRHGL